MRFIGIHKQTANSLLSYNMEMFDKANLCLMTNIHTNFVNEQNSSIFNVGNM